MKFLRFDQVSHKVQDRKKSDVTLVIPNKLTHLIPAPCTKLFKHEKAECLTAGGMVG